MLDKALLGYAARLESKFTRVPQFGEDATVTNVSTPQPHLKMGWALKLAQTSRARFTDKQKEYLVSKFLVGETTGQKANAVQVTRSMMMARDATGNRMFSSAKFPTLKQITNFFSRLAGK